MRLFAFLHAVLCLSSCGSLPFFMRLLCIFTFPEFNRKFSVRGKGSSDAHLSYELGVALCGIIVHNATLSLSRVTTPVL